MTDPLVRPVTDADRPHPAVAIRNVTKRYGDVVACDGVDLDLQRGQVHGILGENGAGKSTLMRILIGLVIPDSGEIAIDGRVQRITDPQTAAALGIGMVHQHFSLVDELLVWENVALGEAGRLDRRAAAQPGRRDRRALRAGARSRRPGRRPHGRAPPARRDRQVPAP